MSLYCKEINVLIIVIIPNDDIRVVPSLGILYHRLNINKKSQEYPLPKLLCLKVGIYILHCFKPISDCLKEYCKGLLTCGKEIFSQHKASDLKFFFRLKLAACLSSPHSQTRVSFINRSTAKKTNRRPYVYTRPPFGYYIFKMHVQSCVFGTHKTLRSEI